jgi:hypothetical protein
VGTGRREFEIALVPCTTQRDTEEPVASDRAKKDGVPEEGVMPQPLEYRRHEPRKRFNLTPALFAMLVGFSLAYLLVGLAVSIAMLLLN